MTDERLEKVLRDCWATPKPFFTGLHKRYSFSVDVCALPESAKCERFYTPADDGLSKCWSEHKDRCWCNPPYSDIEPWASKAYHEALRGALVAMLVPPRTDSRWWHRYAVRADALLWVVGRVKFVPPEGIEQSTPCEPSVVIVWHRCVGAPVSLSIDATTGERIIVSPQPEQLTLG